MTWFLRPLAHLLAFFYYYRSSFVSTSALCCLLSFPTHINSRIARNISNEPVPTAKPVLKLPVANPTLNPHTADKMRLKKMIACAYLSAPLAFCVKEGSPSVILSGKNLRSESDSEDCVDS